LPGLSRIRLFVNAEIASIDINQTRDLKENGAAMTNAVQKRSAEARLATADVGYDRFRVLQLILSETKK
jgi:hypothetical protein